MGVIVPNFASSTEDRTSGALVIDGGLRFDTSKKQYLTRTVTSTGNRRTFTYSTWIKLTYAGSDYKHFGLSADTAGGNNPRHTMWYTPSKTFGATQNPTGSSNDFVGTSGLYRDYSGWYHVVMAYDLTQGANANQLKIYVNGVLQTNAGITGSGSSPTYVSNQDTPYNTSGNVMEIGRYSANPSDPSHWDGHMAQIYWIDGQQLDASYFGYTDPLTNTWRPKKINLSNIITGKVYIDNTYTGGSVGSGAYNASLSGNITSGSYSGDTFTATNAAWVITFDLYNYDSFTLGSWSVGAQSNQTWYYSNDSTFASAVTGPNSGTIASGTWSTTLSGTKYRYLRIQNVPSATFTVVGNITNAQNAWGINGFYLPLDGNTPIGQDQSGRGNNWTPVNFGGSNTIEKATGALPILNTDGGGKVARVGVRTDNNASSLVLALPLVGNANDVSNRINSGSTTKTITVTNAVTSNAQSNFYGGSYYFDGTGDYINASSSSDFTFGTGDFTIEGWVYPANADTNNKTIFSTNWGASGSILITYDHVTNKGFDLFDHTTNAGSPIASTSGVYEANIWYHIAVVRNSGTTKIYINGIQAASASHSTNLTRDVFIIGAVYTTGSETWVGYQSDVRIYKGLAKYTQNFIPASTDPDILPDTPSGVAYSSNVALVPSTDGAVAFDGSGDYLYNAGSSDWNISNNNFTMEAFINTDGTGIDQEIFDLGSDSTHTTGSDIGWRVKIATNDRLYCTLLNSTNAVGECYDANSIPLTRGKWYHIAYVRSGSNFATFIDGIRIATATSSAAANWNSAWGHKIGYAHPGGAQNFKGYISQAHIVNGTALYDPTATTITVPTRPITSVANTKLLCCKSNSSATASDVTPGTITANGNAAATNFNPFTVNINTQRGQESGYATLNPLASNSSATISNGNLNYTHSGAGAWQTSHASVGIETGKIYFEVNVTSTTSNNAMIGVSDGRTLTNYSGVVYAWGDGNTLITDEGGGNAVSQGTVATSTVGDTIGVTVNKDNNQITFYKNGISLISISSVPTWAKFPSVTAYSGGGMSVNFGQKPFKFPPPAGFQPLALANTPRPTIVRPDQYVGISTWTGNGVDGRQIGNFSFSPDFVWLKNRTNTGGVWHLLYDTVRGAANRLSSNSSSAENNQSANGYVSSFNASSFSITSGSVGDGDVNDPADNYVAWCWKAGGAIGVGRSFMINDVGYATTTAAGLTAGTIAPTGASINTKSGFSIIRYTGTGSAASFPHGLTQAPEFVIVKNLSNYNWAVWHSGLTSAAYYLFLNNTDGESNSFYTFWNSTSPSNTIISLGADSSGSNLNANQNGGSHICYAWHSVPGFSKFGKYTGNGNANGPAVITGFRPKWVMAKCITAGTTQDWVIMDATRRSYNPIGPILYANLSLAEDTADVIDFMSNGFKLRANFGNYNTNTNTYIYAAFAETPSFNLYGGQANAR